jgi:hypothetical protein
VGFEGSGVGHYHYATINGTHTKIIATIDEKNFDPDANFYPDLGSNLNLNPLYRQGQAQHQSHRAVSPASFQSKSEHSSLR